MRQHYFVGALIAVTLKHAAQTTRLPFQTRRALSLIMTRYCRFIAAANGLRFQDGELTVTLPARGLLPGGRFLQNANFKIISTHSHLSPGQRTHKGTNFITLKELGNYTNEENIVVAYFAPKNGKGKIEPIPIPVFPERGQGRAGRTHYRKKRPDNPMRECFISAHKIGGKSAVIALAEAQLNNTPKTMGDKQYVNDLLDVAVFGLSLGHQRENSKCLAVDVTKRQLQKMGERQGRLFSEKLFWQNPTLLKGSNLQFINSWLQNEAGNNSAVGEMLNEAGSKIYGLWNPTGNQKTLLPKSASFVSEKEMEELQNKGTQVLAVEIQETVNKLRGTYGNASSIFEDEASFSAGIAVEIAFHVHNTITSTVHEYRDTTPPPYEKMSSRYRELLHEKLAGSVGMHLQPSPGARGLQVPSHQNLAGDLWEVGWQCFQTQYTGLPPASTKESGVSWPELPNEQKKQYLGRVAGMLAVLLVQGMDSFSNNENNNKALTKFLQITEPRTTTTVLNPDVKNALTREISFFRDLSHNLQKGPWKIEAPI